MSIDIRCYSTMGLDALKIKIKHVLQKYSHIFNDVYFIFEPKGVLTKQEIDAIDDRIIRYNAESMLLIAKEFGLSNPKSCFSIRVMDKSFLILDTPELADLLRKELGDTTLILLNCETVI